MRFGIFIIVAVILLGGLFYFFSPKTQPETQPEENSSPSVTAAPSRAGANDKLATLVVKDNALSSGDETITLNEGDTVIITVTSDADDELHIHGYDQEIPLQKDSPVQVTLNATMTGRFPIELHNTTTEIAVLEVLPK